MDSTFWNQFCSSFNDPNKVIVLRQLYAEGKILSGVENNKAKSVVGTSEVTRAHAEVTQPDFWKKYFMAHFSAKEYNFNTSPSLFNPYPILNKVLELAHRFYGYRCPAGGDKSIKSLRKRFTEAVISGYEVTALRIGKTCPLKEKPSVLAKILELDEPGCSQQICEKWWSDIISALEKLKSSEKEKVVKTSPFGVLL